jgi:hypothetical protein
MRPHIKDRVGGVLSFHEFHMTLWLIPLGGGCGWTIPALPLTISKPKTWTRRHSTPQLSALNNVFTLPTVITSGRRMFNMHDVRRTDRSSARGDMVNEIRKSIDGSGMLLLFLEVKDLDD